MFSVHLATKGCMAWDDNLLALGSDTLSLHLLQTSSFTQIQSLTPRSGITCLEWSKTPEVILASGSNNGSISFWKKSHLLSDPSKSLIKEDKILDNVPITNLQFCPSKPNLLAVGASDLFIYNLEVGLTKQDQSKYVFKLGKNQMEGKRLTSIAWNPQVQYILAAASQNCAASVWDLRGNQTLFTVHDSTYLNKSYCSGIAWNPDIPTQFIMAYDDLENPNLQIWDLRKHEQPVKELKNNHKAGVTALSWCPYDSSIFASCDRSGYTSFWNFKQGQVFNKIDHELDSPPKSLKWVPKSHGLIAVGGEDGKIELRNLYTPAVSKNSGPRVMEGEDNCPCKKPDFVFTPNWLSKKSSVAIGYNSKISTFNSSSNKITFAAAPNANSHIKSKVEKAHKLFLEGKFKELSSSFAEHCDAEMKLQWEIISSKFSGNKSNILSLLGFDKASIDKATEKHTGKKRGHHEEAPTGHKESFQDTFSFVELSGKDAEDFFNKAGAKNEEVKQQVEIRKSEPEFMQTISETISKVFYI